MLARLTEQEAYDRELSRTGDCMDCGAHRGTPHTIMCARIGMVGDTDAWGRPIVTATDGHSAWSCNDRTCTIHPANLYGPDKDADTLFVVYKDGLPMDIRVNSIGQAIDALLDHASVRHLNVRPDRIDVTVNGGPFTSYTVDLIDEDRTIRFDVE